MRNMATTVVVGPLAVGFMVSQKAEGWYFELDGDNAASVMAQMQKQIVKPYDWDLHDIPMEP